MKITRIERQKRNKTRYNVYIDDEFKASLSDFDILSGGLKEGDNISESKFELAIKNAELNGCFDYIVDYVSKYLKSEKQIRDKLKEKNFSPECIEETISKAKKYNYIDDEYVAGVYARSKSKSSGKVKIKSELIKMGISKDIAESETEGLDYKDSAIALAEKYLKGRKKITLEEKNKLYRYLLSRGFSYDEIKVCINNFDLNGGDEDNEF